MTIKLGLGLDLWAGKGLRVPVEQLQLRRAAGLRLGVDRRGLRLRCDQPPRVPRGIHVAHPPRHWDHPGEHAHAHGHGDGDGHRRCAGRRRPHDHRARTVGAAGGGGLVRRTVGPAERAATRRHCRNAGCAAPRRAARIPRRHDERAVCGRRRHRHGQTAEVDSPYRHRCRSGSRPEVRATWPSRPRCATAGSRWGSAPT